MNQSRYHLPPRIGWLKPESLLLIVFQLLRDSGRIDCNSATFVSHFVGTPEDVICWYGSRHELIQIAFHLARINAIPYRRDFIKALTLHFVLPDGSGLNANSLRAMAGRVAKGFVQQFIDRVDGAFANATD